MTNNKFTKIALALLLATSINNVAHAGDKTLEKMEHPNVFGQAGNTYFTTPKKGAELAARSQAVINTPYIKSAIEREFLTKQDLPESTINLLKNAMEKRLNKKKEMERSIVLREYISAQDALKEREQSEAYKLQMQKLVETLEQQKNSANLIQSEFLATKARMVETETNMTKLQTMGEKESKAYSDALQAYQDQYDALSEEHSELHEKLMIAERTARQTQAELDAVRPVIDSIRNGNQPATSTQSSTTQAKAGTSNKSSAKGKFNPAADAI